MKKSFIPLTALALFALVSCGNNTTDTTTSSNVEPTTSETTAESASDSASNEEVVNSVAITNKTALTAEWYVGNADRTMNITLDPAGNVNSLINKGIVTIVSSDTNVITVAGRVLTAAGAGKSTITVTYGDKKDSVEIEVKAEQTAIDEYGTVHAGTAADPLDNEDAIKVAEATGTTATTKYYYVKGTVSSFRDAPSSYGNVSYYLTPSTTGGDKFLVYRATLENGGKVTDDDIWVGAIVTAKVKIINYNNNTPETNQGGEITNVEGTKPITETVEATVAEALAACKALEANTTSTNKYIITGYIAAVTSSGFYMSDTKGEITPTNDDFLVYGWSGDTAAQCTLNAKVKVTTSIKYYKSSSDATKYNYETGTIESVEILEEGDAPATIESIDVATAITTTNALDDGATSKVQYDITGYVIAVDDPYSSQHKNVSITIADTTDATTGLTVYRSKLSDGIDSTKIAIGAKVTIRGYLQKYVKDETVTPELVSGTITALTEAAAPVTPESKTINATVAEALTAAKALAKGATSNDTYVITGYVASVTGNWSSDYKNMSFKMSDTLDDFDASFVAFQVACTEDVSKTIISGAKVKVTGKLTNYKGTTYETVGSGASSVELVEAAVAAVDAKLASDTIDVGATSQINVTAQEGVTFTYASSDTKIATVSETGLVTGVAEGETTIIVSASTGRKACVDVIVVPTLAPGETKAVWTVTADGLPTADSTDEVSFSAAIGTSTISFGGTHVRSGSYSGETFLMMQSKPDTKNNTGGSSYIYSKDAMPGVIKYITIQTGANSSASAKYEVTFGTSALSTITTSAGTKVGKGAKHTWDCTVADATYFQIASTNSSANGQIASVTVVYAASTVNA